MSNEENQPEEEKKPKERQKRKGKPHRRGSGSVFRRPERKGGKEWVAQIILDNNKTRQRYFYTQAEADEALNAMLYEQKRGMLATGPKQKLADHLDWWLDEVKRQRLRQSSYIRYRYALDKHILPALGDIPLHKLTTQKIQSFNPSDHVSLPRTVKRKAQLLTLEQANGSSPFHQPFAAYLQPIRRVNKSTGCKQGQHGKITIWYSAIAGAGF